MIRLENITKKFKKTLCLRGLELQLSPQSFSLLLGENGVGKSTLLKILSGFDQPDEGQIYYKTQLLNKPIYDVLKISYMPDFMPFDGEAITGEIIDLICSLNDQSKLEKNKWISFYEMSSLLNQPVKTLSKGEGQRLKLICAFLKESELLILDEPLVGLDASAKNKTKVILEDLSKDKVIVASSHFAEYLSDISDQVLLLEGGGLVVLENSKSDMLWSNHSPSRGVKSREGGDASL